MAEDKNKEILEKLENGIKETMNRERYKAFLRVQSQFHTYSFNNAMLIYLQRPDATMVAGYEAWKKFERYVMRGEKGISILAPNPYKFQKEVVQVDPKTKQPIKDPVTGEVKREMVEAQGMSFRKVTVFDVKQTDGKELPSICNELKGNNINAENIIKAVKEISDVPVIEKVIEDGAKGYYSRIENIIAVKEGMAQEQTAKTLVHELAHSRLHNTEAAAMLDRATKEVQAESVAFIVSEHFGVDTSSYSFDYLANWSSGKELPELKASFSLIQKTADKIIEQMESVLSRDLQLQQSPAQVKIIKSENEYFKENQVLDFNEAEKVFAELSAAKKELFKENPDNPAISPYDKTHIEVELSNGNMITGRFDIGGGYNNLTDFLKGERNFDMDIYSKYADKFSVPIDGPKVRIEWSESYFFKSDMTMDFKTADKIFEELEKSQAVRRLANEKYANIDYTKITAGESIPYVPYLKNRVELELPDGRKFSVRCDLGDGEYKNLTECFKREAGFNIDKYLKDQEVKQPAAVKTAEVKQPEVKPVIQNIKEQIVDLYSKRFPAIKHISENTAKIIDGLNKQAGKTLTITEIKNNYKEVGKRLEVSNDKSDMQDFKSLKEVVDDFKQAQLKEKQVQAHENAVQNNLTKTKAMEMVQ